jgi:hypothetical protein
MPRVVRATICVSRKADPRPKDSLDVRLSQAAELRNAIRHVREVTDVMPKYGEAAILQFELTLGAAA